jgi:DNA-binding CsgD family transcriptional regulator
MPSDPLAVIEAAYRLDLTAPDWLRSVGDEFYRQLGGGTGLYGCEYRIVDGTRMQVGAELRIDMPGPDKLPMRESMEMMPIDFLRKTFARCDCASQSQAIEPELRPFVEMAMAPLREAYGWNDLMAFSGIDPAGHGAYFGAWLRQPRKLAPSVRARWMRVAVHVATALRLRRRLAGEVTPESADAVMTPEGRVDHAQGAATLEQARESLRHSVRAVEKARGKLRRYDPDAALDSWKGLVASRWSLVDHFESGGKRYVLARRNEVELHGVESLTDRERQALAFAALGHGNKMIAYEMGVAPSTVAVLLHRAARKLQTRTRAELIETFLRLTSPMT